MNVKRFIIASIVIVVLFIATDFLIHAVLLGPVYMALENLWRPNMEKLMWIMNVGKLLFSFLFVYIFIKGYENKGILEGIRFGIIMGLLMHGLGSTAQYVVYPVPGSLALKWFIFGMIQYIIFGIAVSLIYKPKDT